MSAFKTAKQRLEDLIGAVESVESPTSVANSDSYLCGALDGLQFALAVLCSEEEEEEEQAEVHASKIVAVLEWVKDYPEVEVIDLPCREVDPEDLKGLPTINAWDVI